MSKKPAPDALTPSAEGRYGNGHRFSVSPDGTIRIDFEATERRNGEWFESPDVSDVASGRRLFRLPYYYDAREAWTGDHNFSLHVASGPGRPSIRVDIDIDADRLAIAHTGKTHPLIRAERAIVAAIDAYEASLPKPPPPAPAPPAPRNWKDMILGTLLALAMVAAIALGSYLWHRSQPPTPSPYPTLDRPDFEMP